MFDELLSFDRTSRLSFRSPQFLISQCNQCGYGQHAYCNYCGYQIVQYHVPEEVGDEDHSYRYEEPLGNIDVVDVAAQY